MNKVHRIITILSLVAILASGFLTACGGRVTPTPAQPTATPTSGPQPAPTQPSAPTPTRQPAGPPTLVARTPARGEELKPTQPIILSFDQPMDEASVKAAFSIQPAVEGSWTFKGNDAIFTPAKGLQRGQAYQVTLAESAKSAAGLALGKPLTFKVQTVGYLEVTTVQPADKAQEVAADTTLIVVFNRPVVPLTALENQKGLPQPLALDPPIKGEGAWINTSIYAFRPSEPLASATIYRAAVKAGIADLAGAILDKDFVWSFSTAQPAVLEVTPKKEAPLGIPPTQVISITFNMPMERASVESAFKLTTADGKETVRGIFTWAETNRSFIFKPAQPLGFGSEYKITLPAGIKAATGSGRLANELTQNFKVVSLPAVTRSQPQNGATGVAVGGGVEIWFSAPLNEKTIGPNLTILPKPTNVYTYYAEYESRLWISFDREPQREYTVMLGGKIADPYGNTLGKDYTLKFRTGDLPASVALNTPGMMGAYSTYAETRLTVSHTNISSLTWALYRMPADALARLSEDPWSLRNYTPAAQDLIRERTVLLNAPRNTRGVQTLTLSERPGQALPAGAYYLTVTAPEIARTNRDWRPPSHVLIVSPYNLVMKSGADQALIWATDLGTGKPAPGVPIRLFDEEGIQIGSGRTDSNGLFRAAYPERDLWRGLLAIAGAPGEDFGAVTNRWYEGIAPWEFGLQTGQFPSGYIGHLYTDRPIYRPGQSVHFKGVIRQDEDARYSLPAGLKALDVTISDGDGKQIYTRTLPLNDMGAIEGVMELSEAAALGYYRIEARYDKWSFGVNFQVAEYRKPEFEVTVKTDAADYVQGDTISVTVQASYYFGGPVRDAQVAWSLLRKNYWFEYKGEGWYDFADYDWWTEAGERERFGERVASQAGKTDAQGRFTFTVPADIAKEKLSQIFTFDVAVTDINDQQVASRADVTVHKGAYYIGLRPQQYVTAVGSAATIEIITVDRDSKPTPNVPLQVIAYATRWDNVQEVGQDGRLYWTSKILETPVVTKTVTTDARGQGIFSFTPEAGGTYRVRAIGRDGRENEIRSSTFVWVSGKKGEYVSWRRENNNRITLVADRKEYKPGETAEILIPSPYQGEVQALVTIERGRLLDVKTITLASNSERIRIPITDDYVPNVFVSVVIVKGVDATEPVGSMRVGYIKLPVSSEGKKLKVEISSDKQTYQPGQTATFKIRATDWLGKPAQAEFSLSLVDLAVLALGGAGQGDMFETFWRERGVGFYTSGTLIVAVERITQAVETERAGAKGGGGGGDMAESVVRREFADTAYWNPVVKTDANGEATVTVKLPDNLTTWRMDARGLNAATQIGQATHDVVSNKPLMVRPVLPRFFIIGDQAQISAIIHNNTDKPVEAGVTMSAVGLETKDPLEQKVKVAAGDLARLSWNVTVRNVEQVSARFTAQGGGLADAVEMKLPVYHPSTPEVVATAGQLDAAGQRVETIVLPEVLDLQRGELTINLAPSLAAGMRDGLKYLEHFPYECIEQTVSRFLPNVITYRALKQLGVSNKELETRLPQLVGVALQRIYAAQHFDGGWGWWVSDDSDDYLTAYVLLGLTEAHKAGFLVDKGALERAAQFFDKRLPSLKGDFNVWELNREVFKLYALANYAGIAGGRAQEMSRAVQLYDQRAKLGVWAKALLAQSFALLDPKEKSRIDTLLADISAAAIVSATGAHWEEASTDWRNMNTDTRTTAIVLSLIARHDPKNALGPNTVRWLMAVRKEGRWESTYETVWALLGLTDWMVATGELEADYKYAVLLNGKTLKEGAATKSNVGEQAQLQAAVKDLLLDQSNRLVLERGEGKGRLYYTADLKYYLPADKIKALDRGIVVSREYRLYDKPDKAINEAKVGDIIQVRLTIIAPNDLHYVVVEDPLPAGCEAVDVSLKTTRATLEGPSLGKDEPAQSSPWWRWWWDGWWSPSHTELRDEKVALFATYLSRGTYQYTYLMRASLPGQFLVIPATASEMYFPEVFGRSDGTTFRIGR